MGVTASVCLSDMLPFSARQLVKPVIEILAAIPSVAYGFFALVVFAPLLQDRGGTIIAIVGCVGAACVGGFLIMILSDIARHKLPEGIRRPGHAMKATDRARATGAIIGKAMTPLAEGRGLVLVVVNLQ